MSVAYAHPRPALTVDCVVFGLGPKGLGSEGLQILLIQRGLAPYRGRWALPGGFVRTEETLDDAARRELREETGVERLYLEQLYTFGALERDPRERVVTVAYYALVQSAAHALQAATDARAAAWFPAARPPPLAFDHRHIVAAARERLRAQVRYRPLGFELLPPKFTLTQLQRLYEAVLERPVDKRNFRKKALATGLLRPLAERQEAVAHRAAQFYRFDRLRYRRLERQGFHFEI